MNKHIHGAGAIHRLVILISVDAFGAAAFKRSADSERVAITADGDTMPLKRAAVSKMIAHMGIRGLDVGGLAQLRKAGRSRGRRQQARHNSRERRSAHYFLGAAAGGS